MDETSIHGWIAAAKIGFAGSSVRRASMAQSDPHRLRYEQWVRQYAHELYRYAYRLTGKHHIAEDLLQETFVEAWRSVAKQKEAEKSRGWLFQILRYRHAHYLRDTRRHRQTKSLAETTESPPPDSRPQALNTLAEKDSLQKALDTLSVPIRQTFLMVFSEGRTCRETAEILHIPIGTVLSRLDSGRRALRAALSKDEPHRRNPAQPIC
jgi:RNA polymerase sigma-70 factor, ECF subfamily